MSRYFSYFPNIEYKGKVIKDITRRARILDDVESNPYSYLPYTIKDEETPEEIALHYYGDMSMVWIVYYSNKIVDPYYEWPLTYANFEKTLVKKYKAKAEESEGTTLTNYEVINWTQNSTITDNILYYYDSEDTRITKETFANQSLSATEWTPMRIYDKEMLDNEAKRDIKLLNRTYASLAVENLKKVING